ncbi:hypothetical protein [Actinokineospora fastidiosa]|uniref:Uncharacterized protein n=1 Tax=Actinokineospora fastidiosa TaxID=1816 RepID=A0A918LJD8_9PSEU|nr:hypothetical protein [Actinokineospora fastidiosa]GGS58299.1 hypothetical protein GCM10010171_61560 [Actinokineospora fastidiosa]
MQSEADRHLVLAGEPPVRDHGVWATVTAEVGTLHDDHLTRETIERLGAEAVLAVPFVRVIGKRGGRRLVVGMVRLTVAADDSAAVTLLLHNSWSETGGWHQDVVSADQVDDELLASLARPEHVLTGDPRARAVAAAKALAEASRNEVLRLREVRYELERQVADLLAQRRSFALRPVLAQVIELSIALGRARDVACEAHRDGLWIWLWDPETYHHNRKTDNGAPDPKPWGGTYRAALAHCSAMDAQLAEEVERLTSLLNSMSTFAVAQDGEAQQRFNMIAAAAAAGLGLPALILSLYGADAFLPLTNLDHAWRALLPIAVTTLCAVTVVLRRMPGRARPRHYLFAVLLVLSLSAVLLVAGALAPGPTAP